MILLEGGGSGLQTMIITMMLLMSSPALILGMLGIAFRKKNPNRSKIFFILAGVYLLVAGGICASVL